MYRITLLRPGRPAEHRTGDTTADIQTALSDLLTSQGVAITDVVDTELGYAAGDARLLADVEGFAAFELDDGAALTLRTVPEAASVTATSTPGWHRDESH